MGSSNHYISEKACVAAFAAAAAGRLEELAGVASKVARGTYRRYRVPAGILDDCVQEAVLRVLQEAGNYDPARGKAFTYLVVMSLQTRRNETRKARLQQEKENCLAAALHRRAGGTGEVRRGEIQRDYE